jgi:hypothetical protein
MENKIVAAITLPQINQTEEPTFLATLLGKFIR